MTVPRIHGGPDACGAAPHDFSTNTHACGPCPIALAAVRDADIETYPDPAYTALRAALAERHGVEPGRVVVAGSGSEFIFRMTAAMARRGAGTASWPRHAYGDYATAARAWGLRAIAGGPEALASRASAAGLAWACEPSSPLGQRDPLLDAMRLATPRPAEATSRAPGAAPVTLVVDRAYEPLRLEGSPTPAPGWAWELWTPNKALGLTGIRGAYAIAPAGAEDLVEDLQALAPSWVLGAHAVAMLRAWCRDEARRRLDGSRATLRDWKARQQAICRSLGWEVLPGEANFFTCRATIDARRLRALREAGVQLRDCTSFGLPGHVRLGVRPPASQDALRTTWEALR